MIKHTNDKNESNDTPKQNDADMHTKQNYIENNIMFDDISVESNCRSGYTLNRTAVIEYTVPEVVEEEKDPGRHKCEFQADTIANGIYLCELRVGDYLSMKQMILQRQ